MEIWKDIAGYEGLYQVSNLGNVKSLKRLKKSKWGTPTQLQEQLMALPTSNRGYKRVGFHLDGKIKMHLVHRLVAAAFLSNPENKSTVNHKDGNNCNNNVENLEWCTQKENVLHAINILKVGCTINKKQGAANWISKAVYRINRKGLVEKKYDCIRDVIKDGFSNTCVSLTCRGKQPMHKGFYWSYNQSTTQEVSE